MNLQKTILDFFVRYGASFITPEGETVHGCLSRVSGEDEPKELVHLPLGYRPAYRVRLLTQGDFPLTENQTLTFGETQYTLVLVRPEKLGEEVLYYKSIAYEQEGD